MRPSSFEYHEEMLVLGQERHPTYRMDPVMDMVLVPTTG
jgi:hypothetical protein